MLNIQSQIYTWQSILAAAIAVVVTVAVMTFMAYRFIQSYQLNSYYFGRYFRWLKNTRSKYLLRLLLVSLMGVITLLVLNALFYRFIGNIATYLGLALLLLYAGLFLKGSASAVQKTPLKYTARIKRLYFVYGVVCAAAAFCVSLFLFDLGSFYLRGMLFALFPVLLPVLLLIAMFLVYPFEQLNRLRYQSAAKKKLSNAKVKVVGITGSYGKTGIKNILYDILSVRFHVVKTPDSFNTPMGVTRTILNDLNEGTELFLCEMGARKRGDIRELCELVQPECGILTGIAPQHLEYFKTMETLKDTKFELAEAVCGKGFMVFNGESTAELYDRCTGEKYLTGKDAAAEQVSVTAKGSEFLAKIEGSEIPCSCELIGKHSIENILTALLAAKKLGLTDAELAEGVKRIRPIPHRLELVSDNGVTIIDDTYNSNPVSAKEAIDTVSGFAGNKLIVTCGFIELGALQKQAHEELGKQIAAVFDRVVLVGKVQTADILTGLLLEDFPEEGVSVVTDLEHAKALFPGLIHAGDVILFLNDLPDNYTESV